jgi:hypothetical protein
MSEGDARGPIPQRAARQRWLPFWVIQAVEIAVALIFVDISVHVHNGGLLVAAAIAFLSLAATAHGPLGIVRICNQRLHLILAVAVAVVVALAPVIPSLRPDIEGIIVLEFGAVGLIRVATLTQTDAERSRRVPTGPRASEVIDATATVTDTGGPAGRSAAPPRNPPHAGAAARWAGRTTGAAAASGRQVAAKYRPEAEAQVKRTIRGAGRIASKVAAWLEPPEDRAG